ncbi:MAG: PorP/SprF family type IX secretion system membrane protein [Bacteroidota bacterium]
MIKNFTPILFFVLLAWTLQAQDSRFSQFYAAPMHLNPAMTGVFEGSWRVNVNYRDQWSSVLADHPFRTYAFGVDMRFRAVEEDYFALGISGLRDDNSGDARFSQQRGHLNFSYLKKMGGGRYSSADQYVIVGGQLGAGQNRLNASGLWFSEQFNSQIGSPDPNANSGETGIKGDRLQSDLFIDFNAGLMWYALFDDNLSLYAGGALYHLNDPDISLLEGGTENLYRRWLMHLGGEIPFTDELSLLPAASFMGQGPSRSTTFGANIRYSNHDWYELAIRAGAWMHLSKRLDNGIDLATDALTIAAILEMERWNLGISYDINTSNLTAATNARGAFELSLIYTHPAKYREKINCPNF